MAVSASQNQRKSDVSEKDEAMKAAVKEALREWLNEKFIEFGRWSFRSLAALALAALVYFILAMNGWERP